MTILWVDLVSELGGAQRSLLEVCSALPSFGVTVAAAVPEGPLAEQLRAASVAVYPVSPVRATKRGWGLFSSAAKLLKAPSSVAQIVRAVKPDIVHANSLPAFLATSHVSHRTPVFWHVRDMRLPVPIAREASRRATRMIAASEAIDEYLVDTISPRLLGRIRVIRNGIDVGRFKPGDKASARQAFGLPPGAPVVGMVAHLIPWKRHDAFIEAAAQIRQQRPDACFVAVGRDLFGEHRKWVAQLESLVAQRGLQGCFRWILDLDDAEKILPAFDLLLHPPLHEPFGRIICEASACGVPVIAADSGGPSAIIRHGKTGVLVRDGEPSGLAQEALALLADPARAAALAAAGRGRVLEQFTTRHVCEQLVNEYRSALAAENTASFSDDE
jgi:glycosyltransferase involved in cell wall biosynthesis